MDRLSMPRARGWTGQAAMAAVLLSLALGACSRTEEVLPGERYGLRDLDQAQDVLATAADTSAAQVPPQPPRVIPQPGYSVEGEAKAISLPAARTVASWPQKAQNANHDAPHAQLRAGALTQTWATPIGQGATKRQRLSAAPVAADGRVFTLDSAGTVSAVGTNGAVLWSKSLVPAGEKPGVVVGGGLAVEGGTLLVTTGYGRLHALAAATGAEAWVQDFGAATTAAPMVHDGLVYVTSRDGMGSAVELSNGRILWQIEGSAAPASVVGSGVPALSGNSVIFPFGGGELVSVLRQAGITLWSGSVAGSRTGRAYGAFGEVPNSPVVAGDTVFVATEAGRLAALDAASGSRLWTSLEGATGSVVASGGALFLVSDENRLLRIDASDGSTVWAATLPLFEAEKVKRRKDIFVHYGPVLAGGRVILASSDGMLREVDPASGALLRATPLGAPAASAPIVANGTLYVLTQDGVLRAFR
ncbi:PQQ-binding-like beta-propeller repeat protein [Poseidonocella sp. HB161398]|uniref:outer membrane protein assembly factor BamB family protein n=1 Tax=Poseidonocella sp. HB161398 TaxID=2320855 RepID=UPI001F0FEF49|nr:PQQ-binding-like beta-propeller repeat protein [Poseidonocella sp. HB161398]